MPDDYDVTTSRTPSPTPASARRHIEQWLHTTESASPDGRGEAWIEDETESVKAAELALEKQEDEELLSKAASAHMDERLLQPAGTASHPEAATQRPWRNDKVWSDSIKVTGLTPEEEDELLVKAVSAHKDESLLEESRSHSEAVPHKLWCNESLWSDTSTHASGASDIPSSGLRPWPTSAKNSRAPTPFSSPRRTAREPLTSVPMSRDRFLSPSGSRSGRDSSPRVGSGALWPPWHSSCLALASKTIKLDKTAQIEESLTRKASPRFF